MPGLQTVATQHWQHINDYFYFAKLPEPIAIVQKLLDFTVHGNDKRIAY